MNQPPDRLQIEELRAQTVVGVFPQELEGPREVIFWLDLEPLATEAFRTDTLEDALDYATVCERIVKFSSDSRCHLIETLAENVARLLLREFPIAWLRLKLAKPGAVETARSVSITIERRR